jgi:hypothetical protein
VSRENIETVQRVDALLRGGDVDGALACFHPNIEWRVLDQQRGLPNSGNGIDSLRGDWANEHANGPEMASESQI